MIHNNNNNELSFPEINLPINESIFDAIAEEDNNHPPINETIFDEIFEDDVMQPTIDESIFDEIIGTDGNQPQIDESILREIDVDSDQPEVRVDHECN